MARHEWSARLYCNMTVRVAEECAPPPYHPPGARAEFWNRWLEAPAPPPHQNTTDNRACTPRPPGARAGLGTGWMRPAATSRSRRRRARCPAGTGTPCHPRTGLAVGSVAGHTTRYKCLQGARPATCRQSIFHNLCKPIDGPGQLTWVEACHAATRRLQLHQGRHVGVVVCKGSPNRSHTLTNRGHTLPYTK